MHDADNTVPDSVIGPPQPSGADFFLPQRGSKSLDAAQVAISHGPQSGNGAGEAAGQVPAGAANGSGHGH
jgi:hypothetical protein